LPEPVISKSQGGRAPRTPDEQTVADVFAEVLGVTAVGAEDSFFDLGGHSLLAVRLVTRLSERLGRPVTVTDLFDRPTPELLATTTTDGARENAASVMLPLRSDGARPPLFCVHPGGGFGWCYAGVPRMLGDGRPVHAFQARGLDGRRDAILPGTLSEMAATYLDHARELQPTGPLHLMGWSLGGVVAHAMAVEAQRRGEEVGALIMLDSYPAPDLGDDVTAAVEDFADVEALTAEAIGPDLTAGQLLGIGGENGDGHAEAVLRRVVTNNLRLLARHRPEVFHGDALLVPAALEPVPGGPRSRWAPYVTGELAVAPVRSTHGELLAAEHSEALGEALRNWLGRGL
ncbi:thioesterase domain-containing protein, partial [Streptomyces sp. NPDC052052]|uniref:alpha/beta fold hydrolase n=1 Tax=Streptomyces sp. NPDC052052 TaxID=3154756 RepID=UPI0034195AA1